MKNKTIHIFLFIFLFSFLVVRTPCYALESGEDELQRSVAVNKIDQSELIEDREYRGDYNIFCNTQEGKRYLEAFPKENLVRPRAITRGQDQIWSIKSAGDGYYDITCNTLKSGLRALEAFPDDDVVRPRKPLSSNRDQKWIIQSLGDGEYSIICDTRKGGLRALEAFPNDDVVRPREPSSVKKNQLWKLSKL
jgi:hypothetical protein